MLPSASGHDHVPPHSSPYALAASIGPGISIPTNHPPGPSPAATLGPKRKASCVDDESNGHAKKRKAKAKARDELSGEDSDLGEDGKGDGKKKRNRMALSCKECKRRKIKCDRIMPVCGHCSKRGRPSDCTWDVFQPANDAFLPPSIARTSELEHLAERLAHVETYLKTLPPNFALFRPLLPPSATSSSTPVDSSNKEPGMKQEREQEDGYSDTEDAAVTLENGVFDGRLALDSNAKTQYPSTSQAPASTSSRPFMAHAPASFAASTRPLPPRFGVPLELTSALTSIVTQLSPSSPFFTSISLRAHLNLEFEATSTATHEAFRNEIDRMIRSLPGREVTTFLVDRYFTSVAWLFRVVHAPSFRAEVEAFHKLCDEGRQADVDIYWLSLLFVVLCLAVDSTRYSRSPGALNSNRTSGHTPSSLPEPSPLNVYPPSQLAALPERWFGIAMRAMRLGEWEVLPRIRSIQTIILFTQYLQLSSSSRGQPSQLVVWLAGAIRLAQVLGLHLLGSNPETMPPEDPAFPPGRNSVKREMCKRIWSVLVYQDWLGANSRNRCYLISPLHFNTDDPGNLNDSDLSPSQTTSLSAPSTVLTDSTADRVRIATARQVRAVFDRVVLAHDSSFETIAELDKGFRDILDSLPEGWVLSADDEPAMVKFQRHFVLEGLHNRIFRLHRPLLSKASRNPKYKFSAEACLKSARAVVVSTHNIREAVLDVPYTFSHCLGASLVLFNDLFQAIDNDLSAPEIDSKIDTLSLALEIFSSKPTSPSLGAVVQQGQRILSGLFREEERRRTARAARALMLASSGGVEEATGPGEDEAEPETFADVLQRIARNLNTDSAPHRGTPPPTRNIPSKSSAARFTSATYPPNAPSSLPPYDGANVSTNGSSLSGVLNLTQQADTEVNGGAGLHDRGGPNMFEYTNDAQPWPFPRPDVDPLSLQFFNELDVGLPISRLDFNPAAGAGVDGANLVADAASYWGAGSRAAEFAATSNAAGGHAGHGSEVLHNGFGQSSVDWNAHPHPHGEWSLDNLGMGGW
ncbi:uncharacterized protein JCM15063_003911 [Sporobolomyces koalae]|uniref:uncharacterized protein n=1 Tax=Sporobolomyces koalae TaxID=500713 RepID=UPI00316C5425